MRLEFGVEFVFTSFFLKKKEESSVCMNDELEVMMMHHLRSEMHHHCHQRHRETTDHFIPFKQHNTSTFVTCGKVVSAGVKFHRRDDVG